MKLKEALCVHGKIVLSCDQGICCHLMATISNTVREKIQRQTVSLISSETVSFSFLLQKIDSQFVRHLPDLHCSLLLCLSCRKSFRLLFCKRKIKWQYIQQQAFTKPSYYHRRKKNIHHLEHLVPHLDPWTWGK